MENLSCRLKSLNRLYFYLLQSLDKQSLLCNCYISALAFSFLQIQHKPSFLLVLIPTQIIFPTCFNPGIGNLRYFCNFSSFNFYSKEDQFQAHDYQLLLFIYVIKIQLQVIATILSSFFMNQKIFFFCSFVILVFANLFKQVTHKILNSQPKCLLLTFRGFSKRKHLNKAKTKYLFCESKVVGMYLVAYFSEI